MAVGSLWVQEQSGQQIEFWDSQKKKKKERERKKEKKEKRVREKNNTLCVSAWRFVTCKTPSIDLFIWLRGCRFSLLGGLQTLLRTRYELSVRVAPLLKITLVIVFFVVLEEETETQRLNNLDKCAGIGLSGIQGYGPRTKANCAKT